MRCQCSYSAVMTNSKLDYYGIWGEQSMADVKVHTEMSLKHMFLGCHCYFVAQLSNTHSQAKAKQSKLSIYAYGILACTLIYKDTR